MADDDENQGGDGQPVAGAAAAENATRFKLAVPVFNGVRDNVAVVGFLTRAECWVRASGASDAEAASALIYAFTGKADCWGTTLMNEKDPAATSWTHLKERIRECYLADITSAERKRIIMSVRQEPGEHPFDMWNRLKATLHLLDTAKYTDEERAAPLYAKTKDQEFELLFQAALEPELAHLVANNPTVKDLPTLKAAVALHYPSTKASKKPKSDRAPGSASEASSSPVTATTPKPTPTIKQEPASEISIDELSVDELRAHLRAAWQPGGRSRGRGNRGRGRGARQQQQQQQQQSNRNGCFRCGGLDHYVAACKYPNPTRGGRGGRGRSGAAPEPGARSHTNETSTDAIEAAVVRAMRSLYEVSDGNNHLNETIGIQAPCSAVSNENSFPGLKSNARPTLNVVVNGTCLSFLVDSSSAVSCMREDTFMKIQNAEKIEKHTLPSGLTLRSANRSRVNALYRVSLDLQINGTLFPNSPIIICQQLSSDAIIGTDFLNLHRAVIFCDDNRVEFLNSCEIDVGSFNASIRLSKPLHIQPFSATTASVEICPHEGFSLGPESHAIIFQRQDDSAGVKLRTPPHGVLVEPSLAEVAVGKKNLKIRVFNTAAVDLNLERGAEIAVAEILAEDVEVAELQWEEDTSAPPTLLPPTREIRARIEKEAVIGVKDPCIRRKYLDLISKYHQAISADNYDFGRFRFAKHLIKLKSDEPVFQKQYPIPHAHRKAITAHMEKLLHAGVISPCKDSAFNTPFFVILKKDGASLRVLQDLRRLNQQSVDDRYIFNDIQSCIDEIGRAGSKIFNVLDVCSGYYHLELADESKPKTAFTLPNGMILRRKDGSLVSGRFQFDLLSLGLHGSGASFSKMMNYVIRGIEQLIAYMDDCLQHGSSHEQVLETLEIILQRFVRYNIKYSLKKARFGMSTVQFLGHEFGPHGVKPAADNVKALIDIPPPRTVPQVKSFCGVANFFRQYVPSYAAVASHLTRLTKKSSSWRGGALPPEALRAFHKLKTAIATSPVLHFPRFDRDFEVHTDAAAGSSGGEPGGLGCVLIQRDEEGHPHPVCFASRSLKQHELNYSASALEAAAVHFALTKFDVYLKGRKFLVYTDHQPLIAAKMTSTNKTIARLFEQLADYNYELRYRPGKGSIADALSRNPTISLESLEFLMDKNSVVAAQDSDPFCSAVREFLISKTIPTCPKLAKLVLAKKHNWKMIDNVVFFARARPMLGVRHALVVPASMREQLIRQAHASVCSGHRGVFATYRRLALRHHWPLMQEHIARFIRACVPCQRSKTSPHFKAHSLLPWTPAAAFGERIHVDLTGPLTGTDGDSKYLIVCIDAFSKFVEIQIIPNKLAQTVARAFFSAWIARHGPPQRCVSDNGSEFVNKFANELRSTFGIEHIRCSALQHMSNGLVERVNRTIHSYLSTVLQENSAKWEDLIPALQLAINITPQKSTGIPPWTLVYGRAPYCPWYDVTREKESAPDEESYVRRLMRTIASASEQAASSNATAARAMKDRYDRIPREDREFDVGDDVLIFFPRESIQGPNKKWVPQWAGPFRILRRVNETSYIVERDGKARKASVHVNRIKRYIVPNFVERIHKRRPAVAAASPVRQTRPNWNIW